MHISVLQNHYLVTPQRHCPDLALSPLVLQIATRGTNVQESAALAPHADHGKFYFVFPECHICRAVLWTRSFQ